VAGVLVVQNRTMREYDEDEIEAMQTIAMVLAELVGQGQLVEAAEIRQTEFARKLPYRLDGQVLAEGIAQGVAVLHEPRVEIERLIAENPSEEHDRLGVAIGALRKSIDDMMAAGDMGGQGEHRDVLEAYRMFAHDKGWLERIEEAIKTGLTAEAAVERVQMETRARMVAITDPYLRERLNDLDDLANRLLRHLTGRAETASKDVLPDEAILVARSMGPAELLDYDRTRLKAVVIEECSPTSHVAIVARALGIPLVGRTEGVIDRIDAGDWIIVDGDLGQIFVRPTGDVLAAYAEAMAVKAQRRAEYAALRDKPAETLDGVAVSLMMNAGLSIDLHHLGETGAAGIGLFRTELQFMVSSTMPRLTAQVDLYGSVIDAAGDRPVIFRTLDIGGDKVLPYLVGPREENPALGWRAIRLTLDRPALLRYQLRALLLAAHGRSLSVMFPMVADVAEFRAARAILDRELTRLERLGQAKPKTVRVGTMFEVPALAFQLPALLPHVDFVSIGSNDLFQFFFAVDRGNPRMAERYDTLAPSMLRFLRQIVRECDEAGVTVSLCGEMAGRPLEAMALIGVGLRSISMQPGAIGPVKAMVRSLHVGELARYMDTLLTLPDRSVRGKLRNFALDHGVVI
jgi:phosphotransferase system enzyme I (PtsP)